MKAMDYKKAARCVIVSLVIIVACSGSSDSNNEMPKADSNAKKPPGHQENLVNVNRRSLLDRCYNSSRDCWHYEKKVCAYKDIYYATRRHTVSGLKCQSWSSHGKPRLPWNYCRNPDKRSGPWCFAGNGWDYCFSWCNKDSCYDSSRNCFHYGKAECSKKYSYIGTRNSTIDGVRCQPWKSHSADLAGNWCRNADGTEGGPYCYINPQTMEQNYCFADCNTDPCYDSSRECFHYGKERCWYPYSYLGTRGYAIDGTICDKWISHGADLPKNYCRQRAHGGFDIAPWCFTQHGSPPSKYCFPDCKANDCYDSNRKCFHYENPECQHANMYTGSRSYTFDGIKCQEWSSKSKYSYLPKNYCRNPYGEKKAPWCYASKPIGNRDWDYCFADCLGYNCLRNNIDNFCYSRAERCWKHNLYNGTRNFNLDGITCQYWNTTDYKYLPENKCRNPNNRKGPWCYTEKRGTEWRYCFPKNCDVGDCYDSSRNCYHYERRQCNQMNGYTGTREYTLAGLKCKDWSAAGVKGKGVLKNYCRAIYDFDAPVCFAKNDEGVDYCFSRCDADNCYDSSRDCWHYEKASCHGFVSYIGTRNYSRNGQACQKWRESDIYRYSGNLCRNFGPQGGPFCYISTEPLEWDYCFKDCSADRCYDSKRDCYHYAKAGCAFLNSYVGNRDHNRFGEKCRPWSSVGLSLPNNYCRLKYLYPVNRKGPWCYLNRAKKTWSYCFLDCVQKNPINQGYSCGMYYHSKGKAICHDKASHCSDANKNEQYPTSTWYGKCNHLPSERYHCICYYEFNSKVLREDAEGTTKF